MFIVSKRNYSVRRADGSSFLIEKDFIGNIPDDVAESGLVRRALKAGMIFCPPGAKDTQLEQAEEQPAKTISVRTRNLKKSWRTQKRKTNPAEPTRDREVTAYVDR